MILENCARAVIYKNGELVVVSADGLPFCFLPGGRIELGESPRVALARELGEELVEGGWAQIGKKIGVIEHHFKETISVQHFFLITFPKTVLAKRALPRAKEEGTLLTTCSPLTGLTSSGLPLAPNGIHNYLKGPSFFSKIVRD